ncbi:alkylated dna repair protein alkb 7 family protein [Acanthamoeba castellanii str. Neff]|uniref:Alkylated dna repair protein alkb 7 family protein n=1 Tax=Acanthamoeba castellanii (strain ATCC 30010 / Neff) TaxID=1257118 RepID=L8HEQ3_ACACF|nr:alkylated dna repair protein alkb 7 family protein [Acanthamoeba castellanii str. Neff]ELR23630.1 alkylated dna repair protein alkb 7 family protein [Acanthamoeba castellanii str. Neff]
MVRELEAVFKGKRYSFAEHWDQVIIGYRECERALFKFSPKNQHTIERLTDAIGSEVKLFPHVHVLDIHELTPRGTQDGEMKPHVDSVKFSGGVVAGLSLLSPCVFELHHEKSPARVHLLLEPGTFYIMQGDARYEWAHGIRKGAVSFKGRDITRTRRLSVMLRDFKEDDILQDHHMATTHNAPPTPPRQY